MPKKVAFTIISVVSLATIYYLVSVQIKKHSEEKMRAGISNTEVPDDFNVSLKRSGCMGTCPRYSVSINAKGHVTFHGEQFVRIKGEASDKVLPNEIKRLKYMVDSMNYFSQKDEYGYDVPLQQPDPDCPAGKMPDVGLHETTVIADGRRKTIILHNGCTGLPIVKELFRFSSAIDEITNSSQWVENIN